MCTAIVSVGPVVLLAGVRDEFVARSWEPPARHWPEHPGLIGGRDLTAGGTWLAVFPEARRTACVLNGRGTPAPAASRTSRGVLPLQAAAEGKLAQPRMADFDPFHLLIAEPGRATMTSWDGENTSERELGPGLHMIVNSGLSSELLADSSPTDRAPRAGSANWPGWPGSCPGCGPPPGRRRSRVNPSSGPGATGCR